MKTEFGNLDLEQLVDEDKRVNQERVFLDQFVKMSEGSGNATLRMVPPVRGRTVVPGDT